MNSGAAAGSKTPGPTRNDRRYFVGQRKGPGWPVREAWLAVLIVFVGIWVFSGSFNGVFLFDDGAHIVRNLHIRHLSAIGDVLRHGRRPILNLSLAINYAFGGLNVWGYHAFNLMVHILAGMTLFGIVRRTVILNAKHHDPNCAASVRSSAWLALVVALIWVVHPLQTQSVTYIIQRSESLMGLFYLLTLYSVIRAADSPSGRFWYAAAVVSCALGLGSKAVMVTAPVVVLLYDSVFLSGSIRRALRRRWLLYLCLAATWGVLVATRVVQGVLFPVEGRLTDVGFGFKTISPTDYALTQLGVIVHYLKLSIWPHPLCLDYGWPVTHVVAAVILPATIIGTLLVAVVWAFRVKPWLGFVGAWFFIILFPTSSVIPIKDVIFEHRMYLPLAAVVVTCVAAVHAMLCFLCGRLSLPDSIRRWLAGALVIGVVLMLGVATSERNRDYRSEIAMWTSVIAHRPNHVRAHYNLGHALMMDDRFEEAIDAFRRALRIYPNHVSARYNLAHVLGSLGRYQEAIEQYQQVVRIDPKTTYQSWTPAALAQTFAQAHNSRGNALLKLGRIDEAIQAYQQALKIRPRFVRAYYNLGNARVKAGRFERAIEAYRQALRLNPRYTNAQLNLGNTLYTLGRLAEATDAYRQAVKISPNLAVARYNLASVLQKQGLFAAAIEQYRAALNIEPDSPAIRKALDSAVAAANQRESK